LSKRTIDYAEAKETYFDALRAEVPEHMKIAMGKEARGCPAREDEYFGDLFFPKDETGFNVHAGTLRGLRPRDLPAAAVAAGPLAKTFPAISLTPA
jgi:hypothetical protein